MILSGVVTSKLATVATPKTKYLNDIVMSLSIALAAFVVGILFGRASCAKTTCRSLESFSVFSQVALLIFALVVEGFLIAMLGNAEINETSPTAAKEAKTIITIMLVINSIGVLGGIAFVAWPQLRLLSAPQCAQKSAARRPRSL